jgi:hypothetical protein
MIRAAPLIGNHHPGPPVNASGPGTATGSSGSAKDARAALV